MTHNLKVGQPITVRIHPQRNGGHEDAHAFVAGLNDDGTINAHVFPDNESGPFRLPNLPVLTSDEHDAVLEDNFAHLPGHTRDAKNRITPGINPQTDEPWQRYDVLHWHPAAIVDPPARPKASAKQGE